ncbi:LIM and calponin homology domains-containing protein 1-like isoform X4 [Leuresthes tenuis]|uniref:LIM and calponin homology domains-containing protein 1-like isoform X4 n=1 Tax=Leuresthes tenuis TaxID=355514 RepID=UPI003B510771
MASPAPCKKLASAPPREQEPMEPNHPEPACLEAQKWIEAVTGKSFGDKDFRSALENGFLLCELLSAIKPGLVKKINRLPTPIAGLDNLSVFLRGCEELGLKGSQLFDPGDLQDTSIRANLKDSDCNRKLKNVLNTVFWLGKAASGCASYTGPTLNLKEFEGLLAQMKVESEEGGESPQKRSVRDSGYDCWDSERSESLSPPQHTRDNSLDSLDSFGSQSQHSPSPDVGNRGNSDGRGSDSEADASGRKPDVRKDDMLARRTACSESRSSIPFNQFLPNRTNASSYIPTPRRKKNTEEGEQRSHPQDTSEQSQRLGLLHKISKTVTWAPENNGEKLKQEEEMVTQEVMEQRKLQKSKKAGIKVLPAVVCYNSPPIMEEKEVRSPSPSIILRCDNDFLNSNKSAWDSSSDVEEEAEKRKVPDVRRDDLASRRTHHSPTVAKVHQFIPPPACTNKDRERWEGIRRASQQTLQEKDISEKEASPDIIIRRDNSFLKEEEEKEDERKKGKVKTIPNKQKDDLALRRVQSRPLPHRDGPMSFVSSSMSQADMLKWERLKMTEPSHIDGAEPNQATPPSADLQPWTPEATPTAAELDARLAQYELRTDEEEEEEDGRIPDLQKDDMMARRTGVSHKQSTTQVTYNRFLPLPGSKRSTQGEVTTDAAPWNKKKVQAHKSTKLSARAEHQRPSNPMEAPQQRPESTVNRATPHIEGECDENKDEYDENEPVPKLDKDDMMARRTGSCQKTSVVKTIQSFNQFLPVPGSVKYNISPVSAMKQPHSRPKLTEKMDRDSSIVTMAAEHPAPPSKDPISLACQGLKKRQEDEGREKGDMMMIPDTTVRGVSEHLSSPSLTPPPGPAPTQICREEEELETQRVEERAEVEERERDENEKPQQKPFWLKDELPPMMVSRRVAFLLDNESASMSDMVNEEEVGHLPTLSQSRYERMHEQYNSLREDEDHWQDDLARWKNRRRSASQELIKKEEERKRMEKRMKEESDKRKSIKTYKEIVEEKERREAELCKAYRNAATPEEAALVLQRYALRFTISDATLDSLKLPRSTLKPKQDQNQAEQKHRATSSVNNSEMLDHLHKPDSAIVINQKHTKPEDREKDAAHEQENVGAISTTPSNHLSVETNSQNVPPQSLQLHETLTCVTESPPTHQEHPQTIEEHPQTKQTSPQVTQPKPQPAHTPTSPTPAPSRPVPLLVAKPYSQPRGILSGHKPVKMDGLVRVNGEATTEEFTVSSARDSQQENKDVSSKQTEKGVPPEEHVENPKTTEQQTPLQMEKSAPCSGSAISSLIGGRNCVITTTIVTELTQTHVEPVQPDIQSSGKAGTTGLFETPMEEKTAQPTASPRSRQEYSPTVTEGLEESNVTIETPMLNLAKRVNHWVWDPNEERKRLEKWQQEQERLLQEEYQREQEKLKKEWEKAQLEVQEEERKHNEEERRILEETVTPLSPTGLLHQPPGHTATTLSATEDDNTRGRNVFVQENGQKLSAGREDQHASKLHFFQDSACDGEPSKNQEAWKTASLDRNSQLNQTQSVKRSGSHDVVTSKQQCSPSTPQPPSPSRCVSGKRLCSGCSTPLGKGAAMIIDTLGLFFHIQCFKCGVCKGQLGDATAGTDVRIRSGQLNCHECYLASRGRGQPTTL